METQLDYNTLDESYFDAIANKLLNHCNLLVNGKKFRLVEIEFYLKSAHHNDLYTHGDPDQLLMHTFYFHKFKNGTYKSGTFKGMDLTFGSEEDNAYFGILVRAIKDLDTNVVTEGPCNVVNKILKEYNCDSIMEFTNGDSLDIFENYHDFVLETNDDLEEEIIWSGPRIGLSDNYLDYKNRRYRYLIFKDKIKKQKSSLVEV